MDFARHSVQRARGESLYHPAIVEALAGQPPDGIARLVPQSTRPIGDGAP